MTIDFREDGTAKVLTPLADGSVSSKIVDTVAICKALASDSIEIDIRVPKNCRGIIDRGRRRGYLFIYDGMIREIILSWYKRDIEEYGKLEEYKPSANDSRFKDYDINNIRIFKIPYPPLCIITTGSIIDDNGIKKFDFISQYAYALNTTDMPLELTRYYRYPFTNVFNGGNNCCMGHNILNSVPEKNVDYFPTMLYTSIGNHDLDVYDGSHWNKVPNGIIGDIKTQYELICKLGTKQEIKEFPLQYLKYIGTNVDNMFVNLV